MSREADEQLKSDVLELAELIKDNWSLCEFLGKSEKEFMVAETIHASRINLRAHGEPFSIRSNGVFSVSGGGLFDNAGSYRQLLNDGLFREEERDLTERGRVVVIFPTRLLIEKLKQFFGLSEYSAIEV